MLGRWVVGLGASLVCAPAWALPGTHAPAISTFDTRGSTVVLGYTHGLSELVPRRVSYSANFSATGGNFSAQFAAHYVALRDRPGVDLAHGAAAGGVGLFSIPVADRYGNGVPRAAAHVYLGAVPTVAVSGPRNFLTAPLVFGLGVSAAPDDWIVFTPWVELAPSLNLDTFLDSEGVRIEVTRDEDGNLRTTPIEEALADAVETRVGIFVAARFGAMATAHLSERLDFNVSFDHLTQGNLFGGAGSLQVGGSFSFHWDDVVPAVLPAARRLAAESCRDLEERFRSCPEYRHVAPSTNAASTDPSAPPLPPPHPASSSKPSPAPSSTPKQPGPDGPAPGTTSPSPPGPPRGTFPPVGDGG